MKYNLALMDECFYRKLITFFILLMQMFAPSRASFVFIDWTFDVPADLYISKFLVDYTPPIGEPRPNTALPPTTYQMNLNNTQPATEYRVALSAFDNTHNQVLLIEKRLISTPDPPIVAKVEASNTSVAITIRKPTRTGISYYVEYSPDNQVERTQFVQTKSNVIHIEDLQPAVLYVVRVLSVFRSVPSDSATIVDFLTINEGTSLPNSSESGELADRSTSTTATRLWWQTTALATSVAPAFVTTPRTTTTTTTATTTTRRPTTTYRVETTTTRRPTTTTRRPTTTTTTRRPTTTTTRQPTTTTTTTRRPTTTRLATTTTPPPPIIRTMSPSTTERAPLQLTTVDIEFSINSSFVWMSWPPPTQTRCQSYEIRHGFDSQLGDVQSHFVSVNKYAMHSFEGDVLRATVTCFTEGGSFARDWQAVGVFAADIPRQIESLTVADVHTDAEGWSTAVIRVNAEGWSMGNRVYTTVLSYMSHKTNLVTNKTMTSPTTELSDLLPATMYTLGATNVSTSGAESRMTEIELLTPPRITSVLSLEEVTRDSATISFTKTRRSVFDFYELIVTPENMPKARVQQYIKKDYVHESGVVIDGLTSGVNHSATLFTVHQGIRSRPITVHFVTSSAGVDRVVVMLGDEWVDIHWVVHRTVDEDAVRYEIRTRSSDDPQPPAIVVLAGHIFRHRFDHLVPASSYTFTVTVVSGESKSEGKSVSVVTNPSDMSIPMVARFSPREMAVRFERGIFWHVNGRVTNYAVLIASTLTERGNSPPIYPVSTWQQASRSNVWPVFQATPYTYNPFLEGEEEVVYFIGQRYCMNMDDTDYCNGPLEPRIEYGVKIRGCTADLICMETPFVRAGRRTDWVPDDRENRLPTRKRGYGRDRSSFGRGEDKRDRYNNYVEDYASEEEYERRTTTERSNTLASGRGHRWLMSLFNAAPARHPSHTLLVILAVICTNVFFR